MQSEFWELKEYNWIQVNTSEYKWVHVNTSEFMISFKNSDCMPRFYLHSTDIFSLSSKFLIITNDRKVFKVFEAFTLQFSNEMQNVIIMEILTQKQ